MRQQCSICLEGELAQISMINSPFTLQDYTLYQCNLCHSRLFDPTEHSDIDLSLYYNTRSEGQPYLRSTFTISRYWQNEIKVIKKIYGGLPNSVLDVGCRTGDFLLHWPQNMERVGVELSEHAAAVASERGLTVKQEFLENVEFLEKFDVVTAYAILEHLAEPEQFFEKVTRLVKNQGMLVIMVPSYQTFKAEILETLNVRWHMYSPPEHLSLYSREFLDSYLGARGFTLTKRRYTSGGMFNPFKRILLIRKVFARFMWLLDAYSPLNHFPIFDHMYSYYKFSK